MIPTTKPVKPLQYRWSLFLNKIRSINRDKQQALIAVKNKEQSKSPRCYTEPTRQQLYDKDVLNNMLSPRYWNNNEAKSFMQYVSHHKSERSDVVMLKEELDKALEYNQARVQGICPIRQQLFSQAFDQLIRQATIDSPERGLLLMRVRDQHRMTLAAYQTLYQSSVSFGTRKMIQAQDGMDELRQQLSQAEKKKSQLSQKKIQLISKKQMLQKKIFERKALQKQDRQDEFFQIQEQQSALQKFLNSLKEGLKTQ